MDIILRDVQHEMQQLKQLRHFLSFLHENVLRVNISRS